MTDLPGFRASRWTLRRRLVVQTVAALLLALPALAQQKKNINLRDMLARPTYGGYRLSPDGQMVLFTRTDREPKEWAATSHIWLHDLSSSKSYQLTNSTRGETNPRFLPDGRVAFTSNRDGKNAWYVISPRGGEAVKLVEGDSLPASGNFSIDGRKLVFTQETDRADKKEWEDRVKKKDDGYYAEKKLTWTHIWTYDLESKARKQITTGTTDNQGPAYSPDAKWIAFSSNRTGTGIRDANWSNNSDIYLVAAEGGEARPLTTNVGPDNAPVFSPDGQWIAYGSSDLRNSSADQTDLKVISVQGGAPRNLTSGLDYSISNIEWSPDGKTIYFAAAEGLTTKLYKVAAAGGTPTQVSLGANFVFGDFNASSDGSKWLVTGGTLEEPGIVYLAGVDGAQPRRILAEHDVLDEFNVAKSETITWKGADNWNIEGILTYPLGYQAGMKVPMILQVHGGPFGRYSANFNAGAQIWAARGYAVLQGNPRGSSGRTLAFGAANQNDWGGKDYVDLMKGVDHVITMGVADSTKLAVMGGSYGGFMTFWTVTQTPRFKAAIGHAGISDWYSFFGQTDIPNLLEYGFGGLPSASKATYERWSPIEHATKVTTPLLITHGENDLRVPIPQADEYYRLLKKLGKTVEFLRYPREGHGIQEPVHRLHLDVEQDKWFSEHVLKRTKAVSDDR
ncbi:MAG: S9 family peptidase [Cytophagaceae bacterium]|nr:S9 family peptidase [Gemmatimonadaceae bacterium]